MSALKSPWSPSLTFRALSSCLSVSPPLRLDYETWAPVLAGSGDDDIIAIILPAIDEAKMDTRQLQGRDNEEDDAR